MHDRGQGIMSILLDSGIPKQVADSPIRTASMVGRHGDHQAQGELSGTCIAIVDDRFRIVGANDDFREDLAGAGDVVGRDLGEYLHLNGHSAVGHALTGMLEGRHHRVVERIHALRGRRGQAPAKLTAVALRDRDKNSLVSMIMVLLQWDHDNAGTGRASIRKLIMNDLDARILEGVAMGMSTVNLAAKLYLSRQGVEYHVGKMLRRFKVANRAALVSRAYATGILSAGTWPPRVAPDCISNVSSARSSA